MKKILSVSLLAAACMLAVPLAVSAQSDALDTESGPNYMLATLYSGLDLIVLPMLSGGEVDVGSLDLGAGCVGNVFATPDAQISVQDSPTVLRAYFTAIESGQDTTLVVQGPDGAFSCNDDFSDSNPMVEIFNPQEGDYSIWVGTFGSTNNYPGYLVVTTGASVPGALSAPLLGSSGATNTVSTVPTPTPTPAAVDPLAELAPTLTALSATTNAVVNNVAPTLTAAAELLNGLSGTPGGQLNFGNVFGNDNPATTPEPGVNGVGTFGASALAGGFTPDPTTVAMSAGGSVDVRQQNVGDDCRGFIAEAPDYAIAYAGGGSLLRLFFSSEGDTTLVVQLPDGSFACNDDFPGTLDPLVDIANPGAGSYLVWVGTYNPGSTIDGTLSITGSDTTDPTSGGK